MKSVDLSTHQREGSTPVTTLTAKREQRHSTAMMMTGKVYGYTRFSTPGQAKGVSDFGNA